MAVPIVGEKIMGALMARRSFQAPIQALGILEHLSIGRATGRGLLLRSFAALILHLAAVEAHASNTKFPQPGLSTGMVFRPKVYRM